MSKVIEISSVADLNRQTFKKNEFPENIKYLDTGNLTKNKIDSFQYLNKQADKIPSRAQRKVCLNTILYSTVRPNQEHYGIVEAIIENIVVSTGFTTIDVTDNSIHPKFLYYLLTQPHITDYLHTIGMNSVSSYPSISPDDIGGLKFKVPKTSIQKSLAKVLSDLDKKIELNNKINTELEAIAKLIYDYWFVQFDFPDANGKPYKTSGGKMVYNETLKREIPDGWICAKVGEILSSDLGGTPSTKVSEYWSGNIPWLNSGEIANFPIIEAEEHITKNGIDNSATTLMPKGTCVLSITRHLRSSILAIDACANQSVVGIYESERIKSSYLYPYLKNELPRLMSLRTGAQQPHINKETVDASLIISPPSGVLKTYYEKVNSVYEHINNLAFQNTELVNLRDWLLPMLMNGQVTVKESA